MCACGTEVKTTEHFALHCHLYSTQRLERFEILEKVYRNFYPKFTQSLSAKAEVLFLFFGCQTNNSKSLNKEAVKKVISYVKATSCFDRPLVDF